MGGTPRFGGYRVLRELGSGGLGAVYEVEQPGTGHRVALKLLKSISSEKQPRLKREFRRVAEIVHPNLATVYELESAQNRLFFTMELVRGEPFTDALRDAPADAIRDALRQTFEGLAALHAAGLIHRDIKPSNVLIEPTGRVAILDFGPVATELDARRDTGEVVGTPAFMAPEQASGLTALPASDMYAVGTMLFTVLTGRLLASAGPPAWVQRQRRSQPPPDMAVEAPAADPELARLCERLLATSPHARPSAGDVAAELGSTADVGPSALEDTLSGFVGRGALLNRLAAALERVQGTGRGAFVELRGDPGIGKSTLARRFVADRAPADALVLEGRCWERESVPFKAFDTVAKGVAGHLRRLNADGRAALFDGDCTALRRLFPALARAIPRDCLGGPTGAAPAELRRQAREQFSALLHGIAATTPVIVFLDDLHWADPDGRGLLEALLGGTAGRTAALFIASVRPAEAAQAGFDEFLDGVVPDRERIDVGPLGSDAALELARRRGSLDDDAAAAVVAAAGGNPLLIEMVNPASDGTLEATVAHYLDALDDDLRALAELAAVAGEPLARSVLEQAAGGVAEPPKAWITLRAARLVRTHGAAASGTAEPWHDRIRETLVGRLDDAARRGRHAALGTALEANPDLEPHRIGTHLARGGLPGRAHGYLVAGAEQAFDAFAFGRSAELYREAIACAAEADLDRSVARVGLAEALNADGRMADAGEAFEVAAADAGPGEDFGRLMSRASQAWMLGGHIEEARRALVPLLGEHRPIGSLKAIVSFLWGVQRVRRKLDFTSVEADAVPRETLDRIDTLWSAASSMTLWDAQTCAPLFTRHHLEALAAGEWIRATRAQIYFALQVCDWSPELARRVYDTVRERLAERPHAELTGFLHISEAMHWMFTGRFVECLPKLDEGLALLRTHGAGAAFATTIGEQAAGTVGLELGRLDGLREMATAAASRAADRGNHYRGSFAAVFLSHIALADDDPDRAEELVAPYRARLAPDLFNEHHWLILAAGVRRLLYLGDFEAAATACDEAWPRLKKSYLLYLQETAIRVRRIQGPVLAACGRVGEARKAAKKLAKAEWPSARGSARVIDAILSRDDPAAAAAALEEAATIFAGGSLHLDADTCRLVAARWRGEGTAGPTQALRAAGVRDPDRWAAMVVPGLG